MKVRRRAVPAKGKSSVATTRARRDKMLLSQATTKLDSTQQYSSLLFHPPHSSAQGNAADIQSKAKEILAKAEWTLVKGGKGKPKRVGKGRKDGGRYPQKERKGTEGRIGGRKEGRNQEKIIYTTNPLF